MDTCYVVVKLHNSFNSLTAFIVSERLHAYGKGPQFRKKRLPKFLTLCRILFLFVVKSSMQGCDGLQQETRHTHTHNAYRHSKTITNRVREWTTTDEGVSLLDNSPLGMEIFGTSCSFMVHGWLSKQRLKIHFHLFLSTHWIFLFLLLEPVPSSTSSHFQLPQK